MRFVRGGKGIKFGFFHSADEPMSFSFKQLFQKESEESLARGGLQFGETSAPPQAQGGVGARREAPKPDPEGLAAPGVFDPSETVAALPADGQAVNSPFEIASSGAADAPAALSPFAEQAASPFAPTPEPVVAAAPPAAANFAQEEVPSTFVGDPMAPNLGAAQEPSPFAESPTGAPCPPSEPSPFAEAFGETAPAPGSDSGSDVSSVFFEPVPPSAHEEPPVADPVFPPPLTPITENLDKGFVPLSALPPARQPAPDEVPSPPEAEAEAEAIALPIDVQNPFAAPAPSEPVQSPFAAPPAAAVPQASDDLAVSPFEIEPVAAEPAPAEPADMASSFGQPLPSMVEPGAGETSPFVAPEAALIEPLPNEVELPLHAVLAELSETVLGFDPQQVPSEIKVVLGTASFASQWGVGPVSVTLSEVVAGVDEQFRKAFANIDLTLLVPLPQAELAALLLAPAPTPAPAPMFEEIAPPAAPDSQIPSSDADAAPADQPFQPVVDMTMFEPVAADSLPSAPNAAWPFGEMEQNGSTPSTAPEPLESLSPLSDHLPSELPTAFGSAPVVAPVVVAAPVADLPPSVGAEQEPAASAEATPSPFADSRFSDVPEQLTLRALFMVDGKLDTAAVVQHCSELIGVVECVVVSACGGLRASSVVGDPLLENAPALVANVRALAAALGAEGAGPLTVRSPQGLVSFFTAGDACLGVLHGDEGFQPGVQERLLLVAAELPTLL